MFAAASILFLLLCFATATISIGAQWPHGVFQAGAFVTASVLLLRRMACPNLPTPGFTPVILASPAIWGSVQIALGLTVSNRATALAALDWASLAAFCFGLQESLAHHHARSRFLGMAGRFGGAVALACLLQPYFREVSFGGWQIPDLDAMAGPFQNRNTYASFVELLLPVVFWRASHEAEKAWLWWATAFAMTASVVATGTRTGAALVLAEILLLLVFAVRRGKLWQRACIATFAVTAAFAIAGWDRLKPRLFEDDPLEYRRDIYASAVQMVRQKPLAGFGAGAFVYAYPPFATFDAGRYVNHVHNDWLEWAVEGGIAMPLVLASAWVLAAVRTRGHPWAAGIHFVFLHALVDYPMQRTGMSAWVWSFAATLELAALEQARTVSAHLKMPRRKGQTSPPMEAVLS